MIERTIRTRFARHHCCKGRGFLTLSRLNDFLYVWKLWVEVRFIDSQICEFQMDKLLQPDMSRTCLPLIYVTFQEGNVIKLAIFSLDSTWPPSTDYLLFRFTLFNPLVQATVDMDSTSDFDMGLFWSTWVYKAASAKSARNARLQNNERTFYLKGVDVSWLRTPPSH